MTKKKGTPIHSVNGTMDREMGRHNKKIISFDVAQPKQYKRINNKLFNLKKVGTVNFNKQKRSIKKGTGIGCRKLHNRQPSGQLTHSISFKNNDYLDNGKGKSINKQSSSKTNDRRQKNRRQSRKTRITKVRTTKYGKQEKIY